MKFSHPIILISVCIIALASACTSGTPSAIPTATSTTTPTATQTATPTVTPTATPSKPWVEQEVVFDFGPNELYGILTLPTSVGPFPAAVIISGSVSPSTGVRGGVQARYHIDHARELARNGFAALRYDPPGVGGSTGEAGFESLDIRTEEAMAALRFLQARPEIQSDRVGLWGESQGPWVIAKAAAEYPQEVAFLISVSGSGVSVVEQQVFSIAANSEHAGMTEEEVTKAVLFGRLLIDWQLLNPVYQEVNEADAKTLGDGAWTSFASIVYNPGDLSSAEGLQKGIEILESIQDEPWAKFLFLREVYIPQLESIPPEQVEIVKEMAGQTLLNDLKDFLIKVHSPMLAFFGEDDLLQPSERSAALYEQYLQEAGNEDFRIVVIPGVGHGINPSTPAYREALADWLDQLFLE